MLHLVAHVMMCIVAANNLLHLTSVGQAGSTQTGVHSAEAPALFIYMQVWAYGNLGHDPGALIDAVAQVSEQRMREFSPQNISNILLAYAKLGELHAHAGAIDAYQVLHVFQHVQNVPLGATS